MSSRVGTREMLTVLPLASMLAGPHWHLFCSIRDSIRLSCSSTDSMSALATFHSRMPPITTAIIVRTIPISEANNARVNVCKMLLSD